MPFDALSEYWEVDLPDFPAEWLPLTHLYDPDLPLFPISYLHALDPSLAIGQRPTFTDRIFGYIRYVNLEPTGAKAGIVLNRDLALPSNAKYRSIVESLVRDRLGLGEPIRLADISSSLKKSLIGSNPMLEELWHQIVASGFGSTLPFGRLWDPVFGLVRYIASWNSDGGRKGELIQTHYFSAAFGERIAVSSGQNVDFYLLPTMDELQDKSNPLNLFPKFSYLVEAAGDVAAKYCTDVDIGGQRFSSFNRAAALGGKKLDTESIRNFISRHPKHLRNALFENYNAFNRGPQRSIIALLMISDLRNKKWDPNGLTPSICSRMYLELKGSFQTPKVIQLYAQQCFGAHAVLPIDIWLRAFFRWPLGYRQLSTASSYVELFEASDIWGKIERLIWVSAQARKVHSSVAAEILWCIRYGGPNKELRGANPISCKICLPSIRSVCPAFAQIKDRNVFFNSTAPNGDFQVTTSAGDNSTSGQTFQVVRGDYVYDEYSARDRPGGVLPYPQSHPGGGVLSVSDFIQIY